MSALVEIRGLSKVYKRGGETLSVLDGLDLDVPQGDFLALMGPSGSGKSTLLNMIGGLDRPDAAAASTVEGQRIDQMNERQLANWRASHVGFIFQMYNLLPVLTAERNVELPLLLDAARAAAERLKRAHTALALVGLVRSHQAQAAASCRAARSSAWASRAPSSPIPRCCCATSRPATSTASRATKSSTCSQALNKRARQDHRHGDARSACRSARQAHAASGQGRSHSAERGLSEERSMKHLWLIWSNLKRRKLRTGFTHRRDRHRLPAVRPADRHARRRSRPASRSPGRIG